MTVSSSAQNSRPILISASMDASIRIWDTISQKQLELLSYKESQINCVCITPDGAQFMVGAWQNVRMYDLQCPTSQGLHTFSVHEKNVTSVGFQMEGNWMFTGGEDCMAKIWDMRINQLNCQRIFQVNTPVHSVALHPNQVELIVADSTGSIYLWDLRSDKDDSLVTEVDMSEYVVHVDIDRVGRQCAAVTNRGHLFLWDVSHTGMMVPLDTAQPPAAMVSLPQQSPQQQYLPQIPPVRLPPTMAPQQQMFAFPGADKLLPPIGPAPSEMAFLPPMAQFHQHPAQFVQPIPAHMQPFAAQPIPTMPGNGTDPSAMYQGQGGGGEQEPGVPTAATGQDFPGAVPDDLNFQQQIAMAHHQFNVPPPQPGYIMPPPGLTPLQIPPGIQFIQQQPPLTLISNARPCAKLRAHQTFALKCRFRPDGLAVATTSADQTTKLWSVNNHKLLKNFSVHGNKWVWDCAFTNDSEYLLTASSDGVLRMWSVDGAEVVRSYQGHSLGITAMAFQDCA